MQRGSFDPEAFDRAVEAALISGSSSRLDAELRHAQGSGDVTSPCLWLIVVEICLKLERRKQACKWLEQLLAEAAPQDVPRALAAAIQARQTPLILEFCRKLSPEAVATPEAGLDLAQEIARFATRLRQPHGRNGAWKNHLELLDAATVLLEHISPQLTSNALQARAHSDLAHIQRMRSSSRQLAAQRRSGRAVHGGSSA